ncbi:MAG TPA: sulfotransferase, partial [Burkholderiaceae bacterium]|nr:sulfotransferase [Burkholderiaceae bacterium]
MTANDIEALLNYGAARRNDAPPANETTLIVAGLPRSGTSMVAAILLDLGVFMGDRIDDAVFEDIELAAAVESGQRGALSQIITQRNTTHRLWGFKRPEAYKHLDRLCAACRNPRIIVMFRDILAIAVRNSIAVQLDPVQSLPRLLSDYQALLGALERVRVPMLLLSYEKCIQFPVETVKEIASFAGIEITDEIAKEAAALIENGNPGYVRAARLHYQGHVGRFNEGRLHGWAKARNADEMRVSVELELDGKVVQQTVADTFRPDVQRAGYG